MELFSVMEVMREEYCEETKDNRSENYPDYYVNIDLLCVHKPIAILIHMIMQINNSAGRRFIISIRLIFNNSRLKPMRIIPPVTLNSAMISRGMSLPIIYTIHVIPPWKINNGRAEQTTPTPNADPSIIDEKKSITDLVNNSSLLLPKPSSMQPTMVMEPTQNNMNAVIKPSVNRSFVLPVLLFI